MRKPVILVTGAGGEIGHGLLTGLAGSGRPIVTLDVAPLDKALAPLVAREFIGSITDPAILARVLAEFEVDLRVPPGGAALDARRVHPTAAHHVNVEGTLNLLEFAQQRRRVARPRGGVRLPVVDRRLRPARPRHQDAAPAASGKTTTCIPTTMYGCNKLYCEQLGRYYALHYKQLAANTAARRVDFRCVRFPGLISATTMPAGGTSDYASEMIHAAAQGRALRVLRAARTRGFRSWRCPTRSTRCSRWRRRRASV